MLRKYVLFLITLSIIYLTTAWRRWSPIVSLFPRGGGDAMSWSTDDDHDAITKGFKILSDTVLHDNWRKLTSRKVQLPIIPPRVADFEIVSQGDRGGQVTDQAVMIFVWHRCNQTATLIYEYMPAVHGFKLGLAAGMVEDKHNDDDNDNIDPVYTAAVHELEEECRLCGGTWFRLCQPTVMDKYCTTRISVYLVMDPIPVDENDECKERDETEVGMQVVNDVIVQDLQELIATGGMTMVAGWATQMALSKLRDLGEV